MTGDVRGFEVVMNVGTNAFAPAESWELEGPPVTVFALADVVEKTFWC